MVCKTVLGSYLIKRDVKIEGRFDSYSVTTCYPKGVFSLRSSRALYSVNIRIRRLTWAGAHSGVPGLCRGLRAMRRDVRSIRNLADSWCLWRTK
jgi:hypothetical protein